MFFVYFFYNAQPLMKCQLIRIGRFQYFAWMSNPMNGLVGNQTLLEAKQLLQAYREGKEPPGTTESQVYNVHAD